MPSAIWLEVASGTLVGIVLALIGGGGSILAVPLLVHVVGFEGAPHVAIGTTALAVGATALVGLVSHHRAGNVSLARGAMFAIPGVPGALIGARLGLATPGARLLALFAMLMLVVAALMWLRKEPRASSHSAAPKNVQVGRIVAAGFAIGTLSGYFGIGGGFLIVPALVWAAGLDTRAAMATSLVAVAMFGFTTAARYAAAGAIDLPIAAIFFAGGVAGSLAGARVSARLPRAMLRKGFAAALVLVAVYVLTRAL